MASNLHHHLSSSLPSTTTTILLANTSFLLLLPLLFFHSRRKNWRDAPPGLAGLPIVYYLPYLSDRLHEDLHRLSSQFSPLFSLCMGRIPAICISYPALTHECLKTKDATFSSRTITKAVCCITYDATSLIFVPYGSRWHLLRKTLTTELFSSHAIELLLPTRHRHLHHLISNMFAASKTQTPVNIANSTFVISANLVSNLVCSKNLCDDEKKEGRELKQMVWEILEVVGAPNVADLIPILKALDPQGLKRRVYRVVKRFDEFFDKLIDERLVERKSGLKSSKEGRMDMLKIFLDNRCNKKDDELKEFSRVDIKEMR